MTPVIDPTPGGTPPRPPGPLAKVLALLATAVLLVLGFMFSLLLVVVGIGLALVFWGYVWWKTRALRRRLREAAAERPVSPRGGSVFDGEARRVEPHEPPP